MDFDPDYKFVKDVLQKAEPALKNIGFRTLGVLSYLPDLSICSRDEVTAQTQEHGDTRGIEILLSDLRRHPELFVTFCAALYIENQAAYKEVTKRTWKACRGDEQMFRQFVYKLKDRLRDLDYKDGESISADLLIQQFTLGVANPNIQPANPIPAACLPIVQRELPAANPQPPSPARPVCAVSSLEHRVTQMPGYQPINYDEMLRYFNIHTESIGDLKSYVYSSLGEELNKTEPNGNDKRPHWDKILRDPKCSLNISRNEHMELGCQNNPGETLLDKMDDCGHSLADLARVFIERRMFNALQVLQTHYEEVISRRLTEPPVTRPNTSYSYLNENNLNTALDRSTRSSVSDNQNIPAGASATDLQSLQTAGRKLDVDQIVSQNAMPLNYSRNPETQQAIDDILAATDKPIARANIIQRTSTARIDEPGTRPVTGSHLGMLGANNLNSAQQQRFYNHPGTRSQCEEATNQKPENLTALQAQLNTGLLLALNLGFNPMALQNWQTVQNTDARNGMSTMLRNGMSTMPVLPQGMSSMPGMSQGQGQSVGDNSGGFTGLLPIFQHLVQRRDRPGTNQPNNKQ